MQLPGRRCAARGPPAFHPCPPRVRHRLPRHQLPSIHACPTQPAAPFPAPQQLSLTERHPVVPEAPQHPNHRPSPTSHCHVRTAHPAHPPAAPAPAPAACREHAGGGLRSGPPGRSGLTQAGVVSAPSGSRCMWPLHVAAACSVAGRVGGWVGRCMRCHPRPTAGAACAAQAACTPARAAPATAHGLRSTASPRHVLHSLCRELFVDGYDAKGER